jgi:hypothetical protein
MIQKEEISGNRYQEIREEEVGTEEKAPGRETA